MSTPRLGVGALLRITAGAWVWASAFVFLYAGYSLGCRQLADSAAAGWTHPVMLILAAIVVLHGGVMAWLLMRWYRRPVKALAGESDASHRFRHFTEGLVLWITAAALLFIVLPVPAIRPCAG